MTGTGRKFIYVMLEGTEMEIMDRFEVDEDDKRDLLDLSDDICKEFDICDKNNIAVQRRELQFVRKDDRLNCIRQSECIINLTETKKNPIVVRYPFLKSNVTVTCSLGKRKLDLKSFRCDTGLWFKIREKVEEGFQEYIKADLKSLEYGFIWVNNNEKDQITNDWQLNKIIFENNLKEIDLTLDIKDYKCYSKWKLEESLKVVGKRFLYDLESLKLVSTPVTDDEALKSFKLELKKKKRLFKTVDENKATSKEFISVFLTTAVDYINKENCCKLKVLECCEQGSCEGDHSPEPHDCLLQLLAKKELNGTNGYGYVDYLIHAICCVVVVDEDEEDDDVDEDEEGDYKNLKEDGLAQNIIQLVSAVEEMKEEYPEIPQRMCGIVSNGLWWIFLLWTGELENPKLQIFDINCDFESQNLENEVLVLGYIITLVKGQLDHIKKYPSQMEKIIKKRKIWW